MADLGSLEGEMTRVGDILGQYTENLPSEIMSEVQKAWTPTLEGAVGATQKQMETVLPTFFTAAEALGGTTAADLSPTQKLGQMANILGTWQGRIYATQKVSDYLGGQMNDMYNRAIEAMKLGYQTAADEYARIADMYKIAWQEAENEKDRQLSLKLKSMGGGGGGGNVYPSPDDLFGTTGGGTTQQDIQRAQTAYFERGPGATTYKAPGKTPSVSSSPVSQTLYAKEAAKKTTPYASYNPADPLSKYGF